MSLFEDLKQKITGGVECFNSIAIDDIKNEIIKKVKNIDPLTENGNCKCIIDEYGDHIGCRKKEAYTQCLERHQTILQVVRLLEE